jgi:hypothetical protein
MALVATNLPYHSLNSRDGVHSPNPTKHSQVPAGRLTIKCRACEEEVKNSYRAAADSFRTQESQNIHYARNRVDNFPIELWRGSSGGRSLIVDFEDKRGYADILREI